MGKFISKLKAALDSRRAKRPLEEQIKDLTVKTFKPPKDSALKKHIDRLAVQIQNAQSTPEADRLLTQLAQTKHAYALGVINNLLKKDPYANEGQHTLGAVLQTVGELGHPAGIPILYPYFSSHPMESMPTMELGPDVQRPSYEHAAMALGGIPHPVAVKLLLRAVQTGRCPDEYRQAAFHALGTNTHPDAVTTLGEFLHRTLNSLDAEKAARALATKNTPKAIDVLRSAAHDVTVLNACGREGAISGLRELKSFEFAPDFRQALFDPNMSVREIAARGLDDLWRRRLELNEAHQPLEIKAITAMAKHVQRTPNTREPNEPIGVLVKAYQSAFNPAKSSRPKPGSEKLFLHQLREAAQRGRFK